MSSTTISAITSILLGLILLLLSGCSSYGVIDNTRQTTVDSSGGYSIHSGGGSAWGSDDIGLMLAFSGGGTRAAALAYGVLEELRDTMVVIDERPRRLLDEIDLVSSVSGGSFTSAYYALYGERIFDDFEDVFLRRNVQHQLLRGLFNPVVLENYQECKQTKPGWLIAAEKRAAGDPELVEVVNGLESYFAKDGRQYVHFVDGGITDNLGLRAIYEIIEVEGGAKAFVKKLDRKPARRIVVISVNASTDPEQEMDETNKQPSLMVTIGAMSDVQLHRYNAATLELMDQSVQRWAKELSTPGRPVTPYFIQVGFRDIE